MKRVLCLIVIVFGVFGSVTADAVTKDEFKDLEKKSVVLKETLHTVVYPRPNGLGTGDTKDIPEPVTTVATDKDGVYYSGDFQNLAGLIRDRDVNQLAIKAKTKTGRSGFMSSIMSKDTSKNEDAQIRDVPVLKFDAGARMTIKRIDVDGKNKRLTVELYDEFTTKGDPATGLVVEWTSAEPTKEEVLSLIARYMEIK